MGISRGLFRVADFTDAIENPYSLRLVFPFLGDFYAFGSILVHFWVPFFHF